MYERTKAILGDSLFALYENTVGNYSIKTVFELELVIERSKIEAAVNELLELFPIFKCCLKPNYWRDDWVLTSPERIAQILSYQTIPETENGAELLIHQFENQLFQKIDIYREPPLKFQVYQTERRLFIIITAHHAVMDGMGMQGLVKLFCERLAQQLGKGGARTRLADKRGLSNLILSIKPAAIPKILKQTALEMKLPSQQNEVKPISALATPSYGAEARMILAKLLIPAADFRLIQAYVRQHQLTINDYLITAFIGLARKMGQQLQMDSRLVGAASLVDLRRYITKDEVFLENLSGAYSLIMENNPDLDDFHICIRKVHAELAKAKNNYIGLGFFLIPALMFAVLPIASVRNQLLEWAEKFIQGWSNRMMTITNLGSLDPYLEVFGDQVNYAAFLGPFSKEALPLVSVSTCNNTLSLFFSQMVQDPEAGQQQLDYISQQIKYNLLEWPGLKSVVEAGSRCAC